MSNKPKFPFRIITTWIHPSEKSTCEVCKAPGATYALENYIGMERMVGTDMYVKLTNDHWVRAIKAQSREQFDVTLTGYMCIACLNKMHSAGFSDASDVPKWHKALAILSDKYGEVAAVHFILVNTYDDEGVLFWFLCPLMDNILDVADFVEQIKVPSHATAPTTPEDTQEALKRMKQIAQQLGKPIKIIRPDNH